MDKVAGEHLAPQHEARRPAGPKSIADIKADIRHTRRGDHAAHQAGDPLVAARNSQAGGAVGVAASAFGVFAPFANGRNRTGRSAW
jgi:hypothetical protein